MMRRRLGSHTSAVGKPSVDYEALSALTSHGRLIRLYTTVGMDESRGEHTMK